MLIRYVRPIPPLCLSSLPSLGIMTAALLIVTYWGESHVRISATPTAFVELVIPRKNPILSLNQSPPSTRSARRLHQTAQDRYHGNEVTGKT